MYKCSFCKIEKPAEAFSRDKQRSSGFAAYCRECRKKKNAEKYVANRDEILTRNRKWAEANPEKIAQTKKQYRQDNQDRIKETIGVWREKNREKVCAYTNRWREKVGNERVLADAKAYREAHREKTRVAALKWQKNNPGKVAAANAARYAAKLRATPSWVNLERIANLYIESAKLAEETGLTYHVDHVVPLRSKIVCGLHCEANLRILDAGENRSKGNRHWPDMPE
jgi:hypothetical protein